MLLVSEQTIEAPPTPAGSRPDSGAPRRRSPVAQRLAQHPWAISGVALVIFSGVLVLWAGTRPGYDPYGWLNWGYQTLRGTLDLGGAPSWKPLPYLFTIPYSLFGHYALWLWMVTSVSISLSGSIFAARIAYRLTGGAGGPSSNRRAAIAAAVFGGLAVLGIQNYFHLILSVQSDPMIVSICLAAIDCHLSGHPRWAFMLGVLASLGRPEAWPFVGLYAIWAWRAIPSMRRLIVFGLALIPLLWFGVPTITNGRPLLAGDLALRSPRELHQSKIIGTLNRFTALTWLPLQLAALAATIWAYARRDRTVLALAAGCAAWVAIEIAFVLHGWPGVPRYMFEPAGVMSVLAAVMVGWVLREAQRIPRWSAVAVTGLLVVSLVPAALARLRDERHDLSHERGRTKVINWLSAAIKQMGGAAHIRACGEPVANVEYVSIVAYYTHLNDGQVGHRPKFELHLKHPTVFFTQLPNGWAAMPWHTAPAKRASCANLNSLWIYTRHHPGGELVPR
jgi:hypothetical protein